VFISGNFILPASGCVVQGGDCLCAGYCLDGAFHIQHFESCSKRRARNCIISIDRVSNERCIRGVTLLPWFRHALVHAGALARYWTSGIRVDLLGAVLGFDYNHYHVPGIATAWV
jgi:hypothetical protein